MGYQFYPLSEVNKAKEFRDNLYLPIDTPKRLEDGTVKRLLDFHNRILKKNDNRHKVYANFINNLISW
jgi:hypothetical protein